MITVSRLLRQARRAQGLTYEKLARKTRIKSVFLEAIEHEQWHNLPEYPVVLGFVRNIGATLDLDEDKVAAFLRRDYPQKKLAVNPKPDIAKEFHWNPKLTFFIGVLAILLVVIGYLLFQYAKFSSPPVLTVNTPSENQIVENKNLKVSGKTDLDATVKVNNQPVLVGDKGEFETEIEIFEGTREIKVISRSRSGKETTISRKIKPQLK